MSRDLINGFEMYLKVEKNLSTNSIEGYLRDVNLLFHFLNQENLKWNQLNLLDLERFAQFLIEIPLSATTLARVQSGIKAFYKYLLVEDLLDNDPTQLWSSPKIRRPLPNILTVEEIDQLVNAIDKSQAFAHRNIAIIETLYSSGLRISELQNLALSKTYLDIGYLRILGKGQKERLVPIGAKAIQALQLYIQHERIHYPIKSSSTDFVFLNRFGRPLSRMGILKILKGIAQQANLKKDIYPHLFRHTFASHLIEHGADLRAVQEMLGHASITTTEIYTHLDTQHLHEAMRKYHPRFNV